MSMLTRQITLYAWILLGLPWTSCGGGNCQRTIMSRLRLPIWDCITNSTPEKGSQMQTLCATFRRQVIPIGYILLWLATKISW